MTWTQTILLVAATAGCGYGNPRTNFSNDGSAGGGKGGAGGTGGNAGAQAGAGAGGRGGFGPAGTGGTGGTGMPGGRGGTGSSKTVFMGGPCVATPSAMNVEVIARASNTSIYRRAFDGRNWGSWAVLPSLDGDQIDARSDLDCSASADTVHVVASGIDPIGALEHAFGFGTSYNRFERELSPRVVPQSPAVALLSNTAHYFAAAGAGQPPQVFYVAAGSAALELTPITGLTKDLVSAADISPQLNGVYLAAFDADGKVAIHHLNMSSGGPVWVDAATIESPGFFSFSPTVCAETGLSGASSINVAAVTGHNLWFARTETAPGWPQFSTWGMVNTEADSSPDCVVLRENPSLDPIIHIVVLSTRGTVIDLVGNGTSWVTTDLGAPP